MTKIEVAAFAFAIALMITIGLLNIDLALVVLSTRAIMHTPIYIIGVKLAVKGLHGIKKAFGTFTGDRPIITIEDE